MDEPNDLSPFLVNKELKAYGSMLGDNEVSVEVDDDLGLLEVKRKKRSSSYQEMDYHPEANGEDQLKSKITKSERRLITRHPRRKSNYDSWGNEMSNSDNSDRSSGSSDEVYSLKSTTSSSSCKSPSPTNPFPEKSFLWKLMLTSLISFVFMFIGFVGGYYSSSLAIYSEASHILSDLLGFLISAVALIYYKSKKVKQETSFSFYKAEILGSLACALLVWFMAGFFLYAAIIRVISGDYVINSDVMVIISIIGLVVNGLITLILHGFGCCRKDVAIKDVQIGLLSFTRNLNIRSALAYIARDFFSSLAIFVAAIIIKQDPKKYKMADPILTIIFSLASLLCTFPLLRDMTKILLDGNRRNVHYSRIKKDLRSLPGIVNVLDLQVWSISLDKNALAVHLTTDSIYDRDEVLMTVQTLLRSKHNIFQSIIQLEQHQSVGS